MVRGSVHPSAKITGLVHWEVAAEMLTRQLNLPRNTKCVSLIQAEIFGGCHHLYFTAS